MTPGESMRVTCASSRTCCRALVTPGRLPTATARERLRELMREDFPKRAHTAPAEVDE